MRGGRQHRRGDRPHPPPERFDEDEREFEGEDEEEERPWFGGRGHHGRHGKHDKQQEHRRPRVQADESQEDQMQIIAGMPVKGSVAKRFGRHHQRFGDDEEFEGPPRHGRRGEQGRHHKKPHGCGGCAIFKLLTILLVGVHFMCIKALKHHQEHFAILTGKKIEYGCKWSRRHGKKHVAAT